MPAKRLKLASLIALPLLLGVGIYFAFTSADESGTKLRLQELGALVAVDTDGKSVGSVTLSTLKDKRDLADAIRLVASLSKVRSLDLNRTPATDAQIEKIRSLQTLESLSLKETEVSDAGLAVIAKLQSLESLHLNGANVTDEGLASLAGHGQLKILDLSNTNVSGGLASLATIPNLNWLLLRETKLAEGALPTLIDATKLSRLTLQEATYPQKDLDAFRAKRPAVSLDL